MLTPLSLPRRHDSFPHCLLDRLEQNAIYLSHALNPRLCSTRHKLPSAPIRFSPRSLPGQTVSRTFWQNILHSPATCLHFCLGTCPLLPTLLAHPPNFYISPLEPPNLLPPLRTHLLPNPRANLFIPLFIHHHAATMETNWSLDYCLACDRQTAGGAYCSQLCRLADLETSSCGSEPSSPIQIQAPTSAMPSARSLNNGFFLPPAVDFSAYRRPSPPTAARSRPSSGYFSSSSNSRSSSSLRILTPSSSHTSLHSASGSLGHDDSISSQAKSELRDYTNSFDQVRDLRRRKNSS